MLRNYLRTAGRFFWRQKGYTLLNVLGLATGLACSFFILLWVQDELRYDQFYEDADRVHRVMRNFSSTDGRVFTMDAVPMPLADVLRAEQPAIDDAVLLTWEQEAVLGHETTALRAEGRYVEPSFFEVFPVPFAAGDPSSAFDAPDAIVLSESLAERLFGPTWQTDGVLGRAVEVDKRATFTVAGVFRDLPTTSTLQYDYLLPLADFTARNAWLEHWGNNALRLFVRLHDEAAAETVSAGIAGIVSDHHESARSTLFLQPLTETRLYGTFDNGVQDGGRIEYVRMFGVVALLILLIASINFMNLATARATQRSREIGVRKAIGATRGSLVGQFLGEALGLAHVAFVAAVLVVLAGLDAFNALTGKAIAFSVTETPAMVGVFFGLAVLTGLVAGSYPAFYLSSFGVVRVLRGGGTDGRGAAGLRRGLVVFQFAMSILLVVGTLTIYRQIDYIQSKHLGVDREHVVALRLEGALQTRFPAFQAALIEQPGIAAVTAANQNPLSVGNSTYDPVWPGKAPDEQINFSIINADHGFIEAMRMEMVAGRPFSPAYSADSLNYVINETAARVMGLDDPVGQTLSFWEQTGQIIGVVRDFHMTSLYAPIEPTIIRLDPAEAWLGFVRTEPGQTEAALAALQAVYADFNPTYPFDYEFLDDAYAATYESERVIGMLAQGFTGLALLIACLGLFGLAAYAAERRTREIAIRKTMGASVSGLVALLSSDFLKLVGVAFVVAAPPAYWVAEQWLSSFAYRVEVGAGLFLVAGLGAFLLAGLTVGLQAMRAAWLDPVEALRRE